MTIFIDPAAVMFIIGSEMDWSKISLPHLSPLKTPMKQPVVAVGKALQFLK